MQSIVRVQLPKSRLTLIKNYDSQPHVRSPPCDSPFPRPVCECAEEPRKIRYEDPWMNVRRSPERRRPTLDKGFASVVVRPALSGVGTALCMSAASSGAPSSPWA